MAIVAKKVQDVKVSAIQALEDQFGHTKDFIFTDYRGLTVEQITALRKRLGAKDSRFQVVKNNFARIAFERLAAPDVSSYLVGPTAVAIVPQDTNEVAKILFE
ncbi:MAG: 50S ribosomal protein L10, partial [Spirochaetaceae bacterium]|nr:50S ribosomal protein L10 [Spirochaetaceae bacterium]